MYKDLVVPLTATPGDSEAIEAALALARPHDAHVTLLELVHLPMPISSPWGLAPDVAMGQIHDDLRARGERNAAQLRTRLASEDVAADVLVVESMLAEPGRMAAQLVHEADLVVIAGGLGDTSEAAVNHDAVSALLFGAGRPVLVVPTRHHGTLPPERILLAWRPGREAARAMHDALPLLRAAKQVDIVVVDDVPDGGGRPSRLRIDVAAHLARHGVRAELVQRQALARDVGDVLLSHARGIAADLIVAGGYGHSRLREWALGGVTRQLLLSASYPVLLSH